MGGPYAIGGAKWPGASKALEECGELVQVLGKLIGAGGATAHWDGTDLRARLVAEIADVRAALDFFVEVNDLPADEIDKRTARKRTTYHRWHAG